MQHRTADEQARAGLLLMNLEIFLTAVIFRQRIERRGVDDQFACGIEYLNRAKMFGSRGTIEQDQLPKRLAGLVDLRRYHIDCHRPQRQIINLEVASDVGIDAGSEIFERLARQLFFAVAHVEHDAGADCREAQNRDNGRDDQQLCR
jgi:hypothetical protein